MKRMHPGQPVVNTIGVEDVDTQCELITSAGGTIVMPKMAVEGVGYLAYFKDPEGSVFGVMQSVPNAQ
jgi:predicted enzyme related to lactoylglutathione lyase